MLAAAALAVVVRAQTVSVPPTARAERNTIDPNTEVMLRQLLELPAPTPRLPESELGHTAAERPKEFFDPAKPPPDGAPIADLVDYWTDQAGQDGPARPTESVKGRLLSACEIDPRILARLLNLLPASKEAAERIVRIYLSSAGNNTLNRTWHTQVETWLKFNSNLYVSQLAAEAEQVRDRGAEIQNEGSLIALAKVDPDTAMPILLALLETRQMRSETLATALLFRMSVEAGDADKQSEYRSRLQTIASNHAAPPKARDLAVEGLLAVDWSGRDDWYLSLFGDRSLTDLSEDREKFDPLVGPLQREPDKWIPRMAEMVEHGDPTSRHNAAASLLRFVTMEPRREAILPLLPWLRDSDWQDLNKDLRARFIQRLDQVDVPECVPELVWVLYREDKYRRAAARVMAHYRDPLAGPALLRAFYADADPADRQMLMDAVLVCKGLTEEYQLRAIEAYAVKLTTPEGRGQVSSDQRIRESGLPPTVMVGKYLSALATVGETVAQAVLERAETIRRTDPDLSAALFSVAHHWQASTIDLDYFAEFARAPLTRV
jgi:hypothetical protein